MDINPEDNTALAQAPATFDLGGQATPAELDQATQVLNPGATPKIVASDIKCQFRALINPVPRGPPSTGGGASWRGGGARPPQYIFWQMDREIALGVGHYTLIFFDTNASNALPVLLESVTVKNSTSDNPEKTVMAGNTCSWFQNPAPPGKSSLTIVAKRPVGAQGNAGNPPPIYCKCYFAAQTAGS